MKRLYPPKCKTVKGLKIKLYLQKFTRRQFNFTTSFNIYTSSNPKLENMVGGKFTQC